METCVKTYRMLTLGGYPKEWRPTKCRHCQAQGKFHHHGHFTRKLYTLDEILEIVIFRFKCISCGRTFGLFPPFLIPHRGAALDVQEQVVREMDKCQSLQTVAENLDLPTESYSEKGLWRWKKDWDRLRASLDPSFWTRVLTHFPHLRIPQGAEKPGTGWGWTFLIWEQIRHQLTSQVGVAVPGVG
nr:DUF6431 domain-containing protein [Zhaonella formicivorans]